MRETSAAGMQVDGSAASESGMPASTEASSDNASGSGARAGADERRRGWFWHWNSVVTQYAPLIGLKGVGLLNSYTVWTDRREESPHRGYAFPSQQAEADFYGEERAELITINKILVALDLIEIRKEMIQRTDERGRQWRVPHNLYRVRDRDDGMQLRAVDVLRVADLAARDPAVFRHVRRIFSERFKPIDRANVWHAILNEVASHSTWQELRTRNQAIEQRASARTKAGHRTRTGVIAGDTAVLVTDGQLDGSSLCDTERLLVASGGSRTSAAGDNNGAEPIDALAVAASNSGSGSVAANSNDGLTTHSAGSTAQTNTGRSSSVEPGNTTYDQHQPTTTTTTTRHAIESESAATDGVRDGEQRPSSTSSVSERDRDTVTMADGAATHAGQTSGRTQQTKQMGRAGQAGPPPPRGSDDEWDRSRAGESDDIDRTVQGFAPAAQAVAPLARNAGRGAGQDAGAAESGSGSGPVGGTTGQRRLDHTGPDAAGPLGDPGTLVVSLFEAANDRRAKPLERTLLAELARDADPAARAAGSTGSDWVAAALREAVASGSSFVAPKRIREIIARWAISGMPEPTPLGMATGNGRLATTPPSAAPAVDAADPAERGGDVRLPGGRSGSATWTAVLADLRRTLDPAAFERLLAGSALVRYWRGTVEIAVTSDAAAEKLSSEYRGLIERQLNACLRRPVSVTFVIAISASSDDTDHRDTAEGEATYPTPAAVDTATATFIAPLVVSRADLDLGRQLWRAALDDLQSALSPDDLDAISGGAVLGEDVSGALLIAGVSPHAQRLLAGRHRPAIEAALLRLLGRTVAIRCLTSGEWHLDTAS